MSEEGVEDREATGTSRRYDDSLELESPLNLRLGRILGWTATGAAIFFAASLLAPSLSRAAAAVGVAGLLSVPMVAILTAGVSYGLRGRRRLALVAVALVAILLLGGWLAFTK